MINHNDPLKPRFLFRLIIFSLIILVGKVNLSNHFSGKSFSGEGYHFPIIFVGAVFFVTDNHICLHHFLKYHPENETGFRCLQNRVNYGKKSPSSWRLQVWSGGANVSRVETVHSRPKTRRVRSVMLWGSCLPVTGPCQCTVVHGERLVGRVVSAKGVCDRGARQRLHQWLRAPHSRNSCLEELALALGYQQVRPTSGQEQSNCSSSFQASMD